MLQDGVEIKVAHWHAHGAAVQGAHGGGAARCHGNGKATAAVAAKANDARGAIRHAQQRLPACSAGHQHGWTLCTVMVLWQTEASGDDGTYMHGFLDGGSVSDLDKVAAAVWTCHFAICEVGLVFWGSGVTPMAKDVVSAHCVCVDGVGCEG